MKKQKNQFSHLTAIERNYLSFPAQLLLNQNLLQGKILDFGCGFGNDVKVLRQKGFDITGYDPYYFPEYPDNKFDTIICFYVLNVLFPEEQTNVLMEISHLLKPGGKAYYAVRRDIKKEGFREHYVHKKATYQCIVKLPFISICLDEYRELYKYVHYNHQRNSSNYCIFCNPNRTLKLLTESATAYAIFDGYPINKGHVLVIPKRHVSNYFELPFKEQSACWFMVNQVQKILTTEFEPDGFNVGMNINRAAGQNIMHASIHIIPRYKGDTVSTKSGIRNVIPKKQ
ncbi:MAG: bifunctional class I SAM-dependent methyltransferase/HIT family protein [Nostoc sp. CmiVER01]|uniref:bifunctional class I SAM-dependent methyltransferase/HIT family protein n=1 Tax=Nostoc sp. CmiVER01 TaxID=3075384 RepID=UPI002AD21399|nr:bifunctional class I SAM-dependent methyltransferase/HIT family protein [Nostoc sp. CmiVER01]MDZ8122988.1 bifunctional class I SAM-dependent methyltransferase/HIT family protein [Nostoc sp. CmiVER01]